MATSAPHLVVRASHTSVDGLDRMLAAASRAARIDALTVDRWPYLGAAGERLLKQMVPPPARLEAEERIARVRARNTETRLDTLRRVMALPAVRR